MEKQRLSLIVKEIISETRRLVSEGYELIEAFKITVTDEPTTLEQMVGAAAELNITYLKIGLAWMERNARSAQEIDKISNEEYGGDEVDFGSPFGHDLIDNDY